MRKGLNNIDELQQPKLKYKNNISEWDSIIIGIHYNSDMSKSRTNMALITGYINNIPTSKDKELESGEFKKKQRRKKKS